MTHGKWFLRGLRNGIPIALGYLAVSLTLGIAARNAGLSATQATLASVTNNASAGEFIGFTLIAAGAGYMELIIMEAVANARYLLMSCALSQKLSPDTPLIKRLLLGLTVTDEIFGVSMTVPGKLDPWFSYGMFAVACPGWAVGTFLGVALGNALPGRMVSALSVGLYGMFVAVFVPPARKNRVIAGLVIISFLASWIFTKVPPLSAIPTGIRIIGLTVVISLAAAIAFPVKEGQAGGA